MKRFLAFITTAAVLLFVISCNKTHYPDIITSCYPIYDFTSRIVGDKLEVSNIVRPGEEPHHYEPSTQDVVSLTNASLFIINGLNLEPYTNSLSTTIKKKMFVATEGIETIDRTDGEVDPHVWLDPENAIMMMENIKNEIIKIDVRNKDYYEQNFLTNKALFESLDSEFTSTLENLSTRNLFVTHPAFGYLCKAYDLTQISISNGFAGEEPTATEVASAIDMLKQYEATTIFYEASTSNSLAKSIAAQAKIEYDALYPLEVREKTSKDDYVSYMKKNLQAIYKALK